MGLIHSAYIVDRREDLMVRDVRRKPSRHHVVEEILTVLDSWCI
jgi:hypothetical protein